MLGTVLVVTMCLADPQTMRCAGPLEDVTATIDMPVHYCEQQAQNLLAQLMRGFPNKRVERYKCVVDNGKRKIDA